MINSIWDGHRRHRRHRSQRKRKRNLVDVSKCDLTPFFPWPFPNLKIVDEKSRESTTRKTFSLVFLKIQRRGQAGIVFLNDVSEPDNAAHDVTVCTIEYVVWSCSMSMKYFLLGKLWCGGNNTIDPSSNLWKHPKTVVAIVILFNSAAVVVTVPSFGYRDNRWIRLLSSETSSSFRYHQSDESVARGHVKLRCLCILGTKPTGEDTCWQPPLKWPCET